MIKSKIDENKWLISILSDLINNYHDHNKNELLYILSIIQYRLYQLENTNIEKYKDIHENSNTTKTKNTKRL